MAKEKLSGLDRAFIPSILPDKGGRLTMVIVKDILKKIEFKQEEHEEYGLTENPETGALKWDREKIKLEKEFDIKKAEAEVMKEAVKKLDEKKEWSRYIVDTCLRIEKLR